MSLCHYFKAGCGTEKGLLQTTLCQYLSDPCFFHIFFLVCLWPQNEWVCSVAYFYCGIATGPTTMGPMYHQWKVIWSKSFLFYYTRYFVIAMENKYMTSPFSSTVNRTPGLQASLANDLPLSCMP